MNAEKDRRIGKAFVLREREIQRICSLLERDGKDAEIKVECVGGLTLKPADVSALLDIPNVGDTEMQSISFRTPYIGLLIDQKAWIMFDRTNSNPIRYSIEGEQEEVLKISRKFDEIVSLTSIAGGWFSIDNVYQFILKLLIVWGVLVGVLIGVIFAIKNYHRAFCVTASVFLLVLLLEQSIWKYFYPVGQFEIGKGADQIESEASTLSIRYSCDLAASWSLGSCESNNTTYWMVSCA